MGLKQVLFNCSRACAPVRLGGMVTIVPVAQVNQQKRFLIFPPPKVIVLAPIGHDLQHQKVLKFIENAAPLAF